jgi:hypothetical protein
MIASRSPSRKKRTGRIPSTQPLREPNFVWPLNAQITGPEIFLTLNTTCTTGAQHTFRILDAGLVVQVAAARITAVGQEADLISLDIVEGTPTAGDILEIPQNVGALRGPQGLMMAPTMLKLH